MKFATIQRTSVALPLIALLALAGCGGGSTDSNIGSLPAPAPTPAPTPVPPPAPTLSDLISDPANTFEPVSKSLHVDWDADTASVTDRFSITSVASDGDNGFHVAYVMDGTEQTVHFLKSDLDEYGTYFVDVDGSRYWLWSYGDSFDGVNYGVGRDFRYFDPLGSSYPGGGRTHLVYGIRTGSDMPAGTATYRGYMFADDYDNTLDSISNSVARSRISGSLTLTADFTDSTLDGRIFSLRVRAPDASGYESMSSTTRFDITDGMIADDGFTATLTGADDDADTPLAQSVRGYTGDMSGRFFGPEAAEVGGVFTAVRDEDDRVMLGHIGGSKDRDIPIDGSSQLSMLVDRNYTDNTSSLSAATAMVETSADGYRISFTIDGATHSLDVSDSDLGALGGFSGTYEGMVSTDTESSRLYLWREIGRFPGRPYFDYLDVNGVAISLYTPGETQTFESLTNVQYGYVVRGTRTLTNDMPSGTATYSGQLEAKEWDTTTAGSSATAPEFRGDFNMTADFGTGLVTGTASNMGRRPGRSGNFDYSSYATTGLTFEGTVSGNEISATSISGTGEFAGYVGSAKGAFYGPQAAEVGGVFSGENSADGRVLQGWFAGDKE